jgi:hypothetical protein
VVFKAVTRWGVPPTFLRVVARQELLLLSTLFLGLLMVHIHLLLILYVLTALLQKRATLLHKCMRLLFLALGTAEELLLGRV